MKRSVSKKGRKVIEGAVEGLKSIGSLTEIVRVGAKMMLQSALEEEVTAYLQRDYYERTVEATGSRNGSKSRTIKTGCGDITIEMPQVRETAPFHSELLPPRVTRMEELTEMIPLLYLHGISTRKVKKAVGKALGQKGLSHQNVVRLTEAVVKEFKAWRKRDLSETDVVYMILDGVRLAVRGGTTEKEAVLVAWGFLGDGSRELLGVSLGNQESYSAWKGFLDDLLARGMKEPLLTVIDGCPGLNRAVSEVFPTSDIQRCTKHKTENVLDKVLKADQKRVKESLRRIFYASTYEHAQEGVDLFKKQWGARYPSALECLLDDIEHCLTYYRYPYRHWTRLRTTNAVERSFREVKGRTKSIGRFQDEERALTMVYWQLKELKWNGVGMTKEARAILAGIRASKLERVAA
jgi:transposase-like protein